MIELKFAFMGFLGGIAYARAEDIEAEVGVRPIVVQVL